jgi:UDP-2-acetamido-3-amino-2,3-dideoxy-glucuronate N-acetyltransferase
MNEDEDAVLRAAGSAAGAASGREGVRIAASAEVDARARVGAGTSVWSHAAIREDAEVGRECVIGRGVYIGPGVRLGDRVKVQNLAQVYEPASVGDGAFIGPAVVFTNDVYPRAVTPEGRLKTSADWDAVGVTVLEGASIGARVVCVAPVVVGRWATVAAGAVVAADVPDFGLVVGVPARRVGWVGRAGFPLVHEGSGTYRCPRTGALYQESDGALSELPGSQA